MIDVVYGGVTYTVAEKWDELTGEQFKQIVNILLADHPGRHSEILLLSVLLGVHIKFLLKLKAEHLTGIIHLVRWIDSEVDITQQLYPYIKAPSKLYGPAGGFDNVTAVEFHFLEFYYLEWKKSGDDASLYKFIAVMYRPAKKKYDIGKNPDGDIREPFNQNVTEYYASRIKKLSRQICLCLVFQYESWRRRLEAEYKAVFTKSGPGLGIEAGWFGVFRGVAADGKFGTLDKVEQLNIHTLMLELRFLDAEEKELKRKYPEYFKK